MIAYITIVLSVVIGGLVIMLLRRRKNIYEIPGPKGYPIIGTFIGMDMDQFFSKMHLWSKTYGKIFSCTSFGKTYVILNDAHLVRKALADTEFCDALSERPPSIMADYLLTHDIVFSSAMKEQQALRKVFHRALGLYGEGVKQFENVVGEELTSLSTRIASQKEENFHMCAFMKDSLSNVIAALLSGGTIEVESRDTIFWDVVTHSDILVHPTNQFLLSTFPFLRKLPGTFGNMFRGAQNAYERVSNTFFYEMKNTYDGKVRGIVDVLLQIQEEQKQAGSFWFTDTHIKSMIVDIVGAAIMTSYGALTGFFLILIHHPDVQKRIQDEIESVIGSERKPSISDRADMPYTQATILEVLRYLSHIPIPVGRRASRDVIVDGYLIEKDAMVFYNLWFMQHDDTQFTEPWTFRPERFLGDDGQLLSALDPKRNSFMPFGLGKRLCPGESFAKSRIFLFISTLLQKFEFMVPENAELFSCDPRTFKHKLTITPPDFLCRAKPRRNNV